MSYVLIFIGGGLGSLARFLTGKLTLQFFQGKFPLGTFVSNLMACFILALIVWYLGQKEQPQWIRPLMLIGFCGGYSTFSTFSHDTVSLFQSGNYLIALTNIALSILTGIGVIWFVSGRVH